MVEYVVSFLGRDGKEEKTENSLKQTKQQTIFLYLFKKIDAYLLACTKQKNVQFPASPFLFEQRKQNKSAV